MTEFLAAQSADPHDPAPMLIHADWLEEQGDIAGAEALRALAGTDYASLVGLVCMLAAEPQGELSRFECRSPPEADVGYGDEFDYRHEVGAGQAEGLDHPEDDAGNGEGPIGIEAVEVPGLVIGRRLSRLPRPAMNRPNAPPARANAIAKRPCPIRWKVIEAETGQPL